MTQKHPFLYFCGGLRSTAPPAGDAFRAVAIPEGHGRLVHLRSPSQETPVRVDHRPTQIMEKQPGALVAANTQLRLELERRDAVGMRGQEPRPERQVAAVHHCTRRHRGLASTARELAEETIYQFLPVLRHSHSPRTRGGDAPPSAPSPSRCRRLGSGIRRPSAAWPNGGRRHRCLGRASQTPGGISGGRVSSGRS